VAVQNRALLELRVRGTPLHGAQCMHEHQFAWLLWSAMQRMGRQFLHAAAC
jgi:hypothetical protein